MSDHQFGMQTRDVAVLLDVSETTVVKYADCLEMVRGVVIARDNRQRKYSLEEVALLCAARQRVAAEPQLSIVEALETAIDQCNDPMFAGQVLASLRTAVWIESRLQHWQVEMNEISANHALHFSQIEIKYNSISDLTDRLYAQGSDLEALFNQLRLEQRPIARRQEELLEKADQNRKSMQKVLSFSNVLIIFLVLANGVIFWLTTNQYQQAQDLVAKIPHPIVRTKK